MASIDYSYYYVVNSERLLYCIAKGRQEPGWCSMGYKNTRDDQHDMREGLMQQESAALVEQKNTPITNERLSSKHNAKQNELV